MTALVRLVSVLAVVCVATPAVAGTISGTITAQVGGAAISGAEVRVWVEGIKGWSILSTTTANGAGGYTLTVPGGVYLIDARGPAGGNNYGDRWYDVGAPAGNGYIGEYADPLTVGAADAMTGINLALEVLGGTDGTVLRSGSVAAPGMIVRMERRAETRIHHNDSTKALPEGLVSMRGMLPANDYQIIVYDPAGVRDTLLLGGPYSIVSNANGSLGNLVMVDYPADPYEGNNTPNCSATSVDAAALHMTPPQPWQSSGARIGPLASQEVDWFCFAAVDGDRFLVSASTAFMFSSATRYHPWTDPFLAFWRGAGTTKLAEDDDSGTGPFDALLDTGPLTAGCHCASVTTFGDPDYNGSGQASTGEYVLRFVMGNRPPVLSIRKGATELPVAPAIVMLDENDTLDLALGFADADGDPVVRSFVHRDNAAVDVVGGTLVLGASSGTYTWTPGPTAAAGSPYTMRLAGADGEFAMTRDVILVVNAVNEPPAVPVPIAPIDDAVVMTMSPTLSWSNAADPDLDSVSYDVELYYDDPDSPVAQVATVAEVAGGTTTWAPPVAIPENTRGYWRVRATDGGGGVSPWSELEPFRVDLVNEAPEVPVLIKPLEGELVLVRRPALSVLNVTDVEDDAIGYQFQIATDADFTPASLEWESADIPNNDVSATTNAVTDTDLAWGESYFARVRAVDARGAASAWSDWHSFRIKANLPPSGPSFVGGCQAQTYTEDPPTEIVVTNVSDPEGEPLVFELELFGFDDDPSTAEPVYTTSVRMDPDVDPTAIPVDLSEVPNGHYRYRVRAFDGTDASDWIECELTLELADDPGSSPDGGCCDTGGGDPAGGALLALVGAAVVLRRRRRLM